MSTLNKPMSVKNDIPVDAMMQPEFQSTIRKTITFEGVGVHSGRACTLTLMPAEIDTGIVFVRKKADGTKYQFNAHSSETGATSLSTVLGEGDIRVETIEHLMAAISAFNIDNIMIHVSSNEIPILDGGSLTYCTAFEETGLLRQKALRKYIIIKQPIRVESGESYAEFCPFSGRRFDVSIAFSSPAIGSSKLIFDLERVAFQKEISRARTFGFLKDVEMLRAKGMALGSSLENSIVIGDDDTIVNPQGLYYDNEFVRHKLLDAIGDTALLGAPFIGLFRSYRGGHALNAQLVKALLDNHKAYELRALTA
ncbi:UDP-3-O-acyl-N-acetylglucosamine deacetylase [Bartonella tamiae]|uniref:UDP-3-O-acyl-N-acetylglucosamine deacetylase n=1 Tax=Bartonella tamiae Th239 TaxID=1094558 RepID=J0ZKZ8_9HYPH|nr:UDP-3-O-acyl-N-acetylglucosamine deacetylase [Bartonella tamiae]EJF89058.1 UDP-3-O-[3-hydroxymyristoyl] N-acetylglucosamine deacetylase [Bartonella tamiae Th239]EJF94692.1 UDP-3-O-[3-hydroxymyristoyl] N-acetylglucosamine deacetylase [Bartonella tamiae Th307]